jgi:RNA polymerase sigma-70 factor (ECF subfamily)
MSSYPTALQNESFIHRVDDESVDALARVERTDNQLVDLVLSGDGGAFEQIFDRHKRLVAIVANRYFRRPEEVEEIIQISFAKAYSELGSFQGKYDRSLSSWLAKITANACFDTLRYQKRKPERLNCDLSEHEIESLLELTADHARSSEKAVVDRDLTEKLLAGIPEDDRVLLQMLYAEEMSVADIAEAFGWSRSNVKIRAWRARTAIRKVLRRFM